SSTTCWGRCNFSFSPSIASRNFFSWSMSSPVNARKLTNVFLSFFAFTGDDIDQLKKLREAIEGDKMKLHLPQHVVDEFGRNRESKIKEALEGFGQTELKPTPKLLGTYPEVKEYEDVKQKLQKLVSQLLSSAKKDAETKQLAADELFAQL